MKRAVVLGGGVAGICVAFGLRDRGYDVELLESRGWLGGRAFSLPNRGEDCLDNGPHVMLGCYDRMRELLRRIGTESEFAVGRSLAVSYRLPGGGRARLALPGLPTPLVMPWGLLRLPLGIGGRARAIWGLINVLRGAPKSWTLAEWIRRRRQSGAPTQFFWEPLCRAVMNAEPERVSAGLFLRTLRQAFTGGASRAAIWIPRRAWQVVVGDAAGRRLERDGVRVSLRARVRALERQDDRIVAVHLGSGERREVGVDELVVSALPWHSIGRLLGTVTPGSELAGSPLVSIYFETSDREAPPDDGPLVALVGGSPFHFLYRTPEGAPGRFCLLAGGCEELDGLSVADIERRAREQLATYYSEWDAATPASVRVVKEARATIVAAPGVQRPEPGFIEGGPRNLLLCGDWLDTRLPSTLEGAALSARLALKRLERGL